MPLLDRTGEIADRWLDADRDAPLPSGYELILPLSRAEADGPAAVAAGRRFGIAVPGSTTLGALAPWLDRASLIVVVFPSFTDGRGFSLARQLRVRGFRGELRARGALIADQFSFALASGFDTVQLDSSVLARQPVADWLAAVDAISLSYQRDYAAPRNILEARRAARGASKAAVTQTEPVK